MKKATPNAAPNHPPDASQSPRESAVASAKGFDVSDFVLAVALFGVALLLYLVTLAPTVTFVDSGELAAAIVTNGVSHPSGSPLYLILGSWAVAIPIKTLIWRLNAFSALCAAGAVLFTFLYFRQHPPAPVAAPQNKAGNKSKKKKSEAVSKPIQLPRSLLFGAVAAALAFMTNRALWSTATVTEVYALHALLMALIAWLLGLHVFEIGKNPGNPRLRFLGMAAFVSGLGVSNYPPFGLVAPAILAVLWKVEGRAFLFKWRRNLVMAVCVAAGLLPYALLPIRAAADPLLNWGNPSNWERFWKHISAQQYSVFLGSPRLTALPDALKLWSTQWPVGILLLIVPGLFFFRKHRPAAFLFTVVLGAANLLYVLCYDITDVSSAPSDYYVYLLPLCWCSALWIGAGLCWILQLEIVARFGKTAAVAAAIVPLICVPLHWKEMDRSRYTYADDFARSILESVAPNAVILSPDWTFVSPSMYLQFGEKVRTDVLVLDGELLRRSWYFPFLRKRNPGLYSSCKPAIDAFLQELAKYEEGKTYDGNLITEKYVAMLNGLLHEGANSGHPPYILLNLQAKEADAESYTSMERQLHRPPYFTTGVAPQAIGNGFQWAPESVAFRLYDDNLVHSLPGVQIPSRPFDLSKPYDNVTYGVIARYADFWRYRGDYHRAAGDCSLAADAYRKSLSISVEPEAEAGLAACAK